MTEHLHILRSSDAIIQESA